MQSSSSNNLPAPKTSPNSLNNLIISPNLKFLMDHITSLIPSQLSSDSYITWRAQVHCIFSATGFSNFLDTPTISSSSAMNLDAIWLTTDQFLIAALHSTISALVLPYVIHLDHCYQIWHTLETRMNSSTRQHIIQLKNELHNIKKQDLTIPQYLN